MRYTLISIISLLPVLALADEIAEPKLSDHLTAEVVDNHQSHSRYTLIDAITKTMLTSSSEDNFIFYKYNYMLFNGGDTKAEYSFQYRIFRNNSTYFAFSNRMFWDLRADSSPSRDISFVPELFYRLTAPLPETMSVDAGYIHNSNGRSAAESRNFNRIFLRLNNYFSYHSTRIFTVTNLYYMFQKSAENNDIDQYLGFWDMRVIMPVTFLNNSNTVGLQLVSGENGNPFDKGSYYVDMMFKMGNQNFNPYLYIQYYNGYVETLLDYSDKITVLRFGVAFYY